MPPLGRRVTMSSELDVFLEPGADRRAADQREDNSPSTVAEMCPDAGPRSCARGRYAHRVSGRSPSTIVPA